MTISASDLLGHALSLLASKRDARIAPFLDEVPGDMAERVLDPADLPCTRHLAGSLQAASDETRVLLKALRSASPQLRWGQTYSSADLPAEFLDNYGWVELFGTRGHFENDRVAGGFLVLGPHAHYPDHHHLAEEIYVPLTGGAHWRKGEGDFVEREAGEVIHHPSNVNHAMRTEAVPLVALYLWRGGPLAAKSTLTA